METEEDECYGDDLLLDENSLFEDECLMLLALDTVLASLTEAEYRLVEFLYLSEKPGTIRDYEALTGISKSTVSRLHITIIAKLKKFFEE
jgi:DNA-directed RNA polymerase specialized sigma subunit